MANALYSKGREKFLKGDISWDTDNIKVALLAGTYLGGSVAHDTDEWFSDIASHVLTGTAPIKSLASKTTSITNNGTTTYGIASAAAVTFSSITSNQTIAYVAVFKDTNGSNIDGEPAAQDQDSCPLIALFDSGYGIGAGTNGGDIRITWDPINGMFKL